MASDPGTPEAAPRQPSLFSGIRGRILAIALAPALLVAGALATLFIQQGLEKSEANLYAQGRLIANHIAKLAEFDLFIGNTTYLQQLLNYQRLSHDVLAIGIIDSHKQWIALSGDSGLLAPAPHGDTPQAWREGQRLVFVQPVLPGGQSDDPYLADNLSAITLGHVTLALSTEPIDRLRREILLRSLLVLLIVLAAGGMLAWRMSEGFSRQLLEIGQAVGRIAGGLLSTRLPGTGTGELKQLEHDINRMADSLESHRGELEDRIRQATENLTKQKQAAEEAVRAKARFLAAASHDLRQPMHALSLLVAALREKPLEPGAQRLVQHIEASTTAMEGLFNSLLDLSRLDAGVVEAHPSCVALNEVLDRIRNHFLPLAQEKGLELHVQCTSICLQTDSLLLERIVGNLVSNAIRYTPSGRVLVGVRRHGKGRFARIEVRDTGPGIPKRYKNRIFEEYFQLENPERDRSKGLGLGLAIVSRLARLLGPHKVQVHSASGKGSCFSLSQTRCTPSHQQAIEFAEPPQGQLMPALVAVIDDDQSILEAMAELLSSWGLDIAAAPDADSLIADLRAAELKPDAILSDYRLRSGKTGVEAIAKVCKAMNESIPAALLTGDTAPEIIQAISGTGLPLLYKPLRPAKLRALLIHLLQERS